MSERPFMQLYVSDFIGDTLHLSTEQIGAYMLLLMAMWNAGGKLPSDEAKLARVTRMSVKKWRAVASDLMAFFDAEGSEIRHNRLTKELHKSESKSQSRASAGSAGGTSKALKDKEAYVANAMRSPQHLPDTRNHIVEAKASYIDHEFEEDFWPLYPRKVGKGQAIKAYRAARKLADAESISVGVKRYSAERAGQDPAFTRHAATWLNGQCWTDEPAPLPTLRPVGQSPPRRERTMNDAIDDFIRNNSHEPAAGPTIDHDERDYPPVVHLLATSSRAGS